MKFLIDFSWPIAVAIAAYAVYSLIVKPKMVEAAKVLGKADTLSTKTGIAWIWAKVDGWKTPILSSIAGIFQMVQLIPADLISEWQQLPWGGVFQSTVANKISVACAFLIAITHAVGIAKAAKATPKAPE
jgi:hypothetical protein